MKFEIKIKGIKKKVDVRGAIVPKEYFASPWLADGQLGLLRNFILSRETRNFTGVYVHCTVYNVHVIHIQYIV